MSMWTDCGKGLGTGRVRGVWNPEPEGPVSGSEIR